MRAKFPERIVREHVHVCGETLLTIVKPSGTVNAVKSPGLLIPRCWHNDHPYGKKKKKRKKEKKDAYKRYKHTYGFSEKYIYKIQDFFKCCHGNHLRQNPIAFAPPDNVW